MSRSLSPEQVRHLFDAVVELDPRARAAFLDRACASDPDLRQEVEALLSAYHHTEDALRDDEPFAGTLRSAAAQEAPSVDPYRLSGQTVSHYRVLEKLGGGGMGVVYKARDLRLDRTVALKFLPPHLSADETAKERFIAEAKAASALDHPHIGTIYEIEEAPAEVGAEGQLFIAMAFYEGETLKKKIERGPLPVQEAVRYAIQVAEGLAAAHSRGIVHRDVKPANVMVTSDGIAKVVDFGIAKIATGTTLTRTGRSMGTPAYMSPEQARGQRVDHRTDIWSLGVVLYEMLTGQRPFQGEYEQAMFYAIWQEEPEPVRARRPEVPEKLARVVEKALAKAPEARYRSMDELLADLKLLDEVSPPSRPAAGPAPAKRAPGRRLAIYGSAALLLALLVAGGIRFFGGQGEQIDAIAVLPLVNLSADPEQEYFADGMTEALIAELAQIQALKKVISRQSVMRFKDSQTPLPEIARALGVDAVVEGSVARSGDRVRITAQLIQGRTERHLWAKSYERELSDILALQREMAMAIAREVEAELEPEERARMSQSRRVDPEAYELYLRGRHFRQQDTPEAYERARAYFEQAIAKDSAFAEAYAGLGTVYALMGIWGMLPKEEAEVKARPAIERALELDETSWEAHLALRWFASDPAGAERAHRRAIELNPNSREAHREYGRFLSGMGRFEEGLKALRRAVELDPLSVQALTSLADGYNWSRQHERAIEQAQKALELDPSHVLAHSALGNAYLAKGRYAEAIAAFEKVEAIWGSHPFSSAYLGYAYAASGRRSEALEEIEALKAQRAQSGGWAGAIALVYTALGEKEEALDWLEQAYEEGSVLGYLKVEFIFDPLRSEPRFQALLRKEGLEQ